MELRELTLEEYAGFLDEADVAWNYMQSPRFIKSHLGNRDIKIYGAEEDGKLLYAFYVMFRPAMKLFKYAYSPREWVPAAPELMKDEKRIREMTEKASERLKAEGAVLWMFESNVEYEPHDASGKVLDAFNNEPYRDMLVRAGFEKSPLWTGYDDSRLSRWVSWIDLQKGLQEKALGFPTNRDNGLEEYTWKELLKQMSGNTRRSFQKTDLPYIEVVATPGDSDFDLTVFDELMECSAEKHHFSAAGGAERRDLLKAFGDKGYVTVSYLNMPAYEKFLHDKADEFAAAEKAALEVCEKMPNSKKKLNQLKEIQEQKSHNEKELAALDELKKTETAERIPLAGGLFLETPTEMLYLYGGSRPDLARYMGPYAVQKVMIHKALDHGLQRYNFWGISGNFEPDQEGYGVFYFKKNLGATVGEYCGEFIRPLKPALARTVLKRIRPQIA